MTGEAGAPAPAVRRRAGLTVVAFGMVSLFADFVYEGSRSVIGPYLATLGAGAVVVGVTSGLGEFVGYALRAVAGVAADRTRAYWALTITGYTLTVAAVPLLALAGNVEVAVALVVAERLGKAVRTPSRDVLLAEASAPIGSGRAFGLHEALDQAGAVAGPLLLAAVLAARPGDYRYGFALLAVPAVLSLLSLVVAHRLQPPPTAVPLPTGEEVGTRLGVTARRYLGFVAIAGIGLAPFPVLAFHLVQRQVLAEDLIPVVFAVAMGVDAVAALASGRLFDRRGLRVLYLLPPLTALALVAFTTSPLLVWLGAAAWGSAIGIQESTLRAGLTVLTPTGRRGAAFGLFGAVYGTSLLIAGVAFGYLYQVGIPYLVAAVVVTQGAALAAIRATTSEGASRPP